MSGNWPHLFHLPNRPFLMTVARSGDFRRNYIPEGVLVEEDSLHHNQSASTTLNLLDDPGIPAIFEGGFVEDGVRVRADILARADNRMWDLIEVKSSTSLKEVHGPDVAVQYHVLMAAGC